MLKRSGKLAFYTLHLSPGISDHDREEAIAACPAFIESPRPYDEILDEAGFEDIAQHDVTAAYRATAMRSIDASLALESGLRAALGDATFEERFEGRRRGVAEVDAGVRQRSLWTARSPE